MVEKSKARKVRVICVERLSITRVEMDQYQWQVNGLFLFYFIYYIFNVVLKVVGYL